MPVEKVMADIGPQIAAMDKAIAQCEERYGSRIKAPGPSHPRTTDGEAMAKVSLAHGRHHVKQISKMKAAASNGGLGPRLS